MQNSTKWFDVPGYSGLYQINTDGEVISRHHRFYGRMLRQFPRARNDKTLCVVLRMNNKPRIWPVQSLMVQTFLQGRPAGMVIYHKDGCTQNNSLCNLGFASRSTVGRMVGGNHTRGVVVKIDENGEALEYYASATEAARKNYTSRKTIERQCRHQAKNAFDDNGTRFVYDDEFFRVIQRRKEA